MRDYSGDSRAQVKDRFRARVRAREELIRAREELIRARDEFR
jgi:hypothetical protein